eukprot:TRINITY_DN1839_c0_g1_i1.p1 TRINITY_DN1839_c0_g1~~TRINITY_DN1839_c0_g1_i1.p1  ORF type:complete len:193 (-),score=35.54 TRINITY_DN1839_c0_g1_i1:152-694(-)
MDALGAVPSVASENGGAVKDSSKLTPLEAKDDADETDFVEVTFNPLVLDKYVVAVRDTSAGAVATFSGVTRDTFEGKRVVQLEYEAYVPMAISKLREVCSTARSRWQICRSAMAHRLGLVPVGEVRVIVVVSSVHRKEALEACHFMIDEIKAKVPIWKKEVYEGGDQTWKENKEFAPAQL